MSARIPLQGMADQTLCEVLSERATYVPLDDGQDIHESSPTVLVFSTSRLSIENPFVLDSDRRSAIQDFVGATVAEAFSTADELCIEFTDGDRISISLRDEDFTTPEAATYVPNHGPIVVFN